MSSTVRLAYVSVARREMTGRDIEQILTVSRLYNSVSGVTGILVYHEQTFLQILEGHPDSLSDVYERIQRDWRHDGCVQVLNEEITNRAFEGWSMAYKSPETMLSAHKLMMLDLHQLIKRVEQQDLSRHPALRVLLKALLAEGLKTPNAA
ncbi:MAG: BLUF domain-containing protein [Pseudomonadota bacterium]